MAAVMDVKQTKSFCDDVYTDLIAVKNKLLEMRGRAQKQGAENEVIGMFERHLAEMVEAVDWKIQILAHSCPYDWKGSTQFESNAQIGQEDKLPDQNFSPGYVGG